MGRPRSWSDRLENQGKNYGTDYSRVYRHLDQYFEELFSSDGETLSLKEISDRIKQITNHQIGLKTLRRYLEKCQEKGEAPLEEIYRLNPRYFQRR